MTYNSLQMQFIQDILTSVCVSGSNSGPSGDFVQDQIVKKTKSIG